MMYQTYIFDLYGTLVDIHTDETKIEVWEKMALFYGYYGAFYTAEELRQTYRELTQEAEKEALRHDSHESFPELQIEDVFLELFRRKGADVLKETAVYAGQFFRVLTTEYIRLYDGTRELLEALKASGGSLYLLSNAQRIFTAYEMKRRRMRILYWKKWISAGLRKCCFPVRKRKPCGFALTGRKMPKRWHSFSMIQYIRSMRLIIQRNSWMCGLRKSVIFIHGTSPFFCIGR